jgi:8-oxo-dGTP pyrophosphatase MutT (NUDIX family)
MDRAAVVLVVDGHVALIRNEKEGRRRYYFPGGRIEKGEPPGETAQREFAEEYGIEIQVGRVLAEVETDGETHRFYQARLAPDAPDTPARMPPPRKPYASWTPLVDLPELDVHPRAVADAVAGGTIASWNGRRLDAAG